MSDRPRIFVIGGTVSARDPLDPTPAIRRSLEDEFEVLEVRPGGALTIRGVMQSRRPGTDVVLFDFSEPAAVKSLIDLPKTLSGVVMLGADKLMRESPVLRVWHDALVVSPEDWPLATVLALEANFGGRSLYTEYPLRAVESQSSDLIAGTVLENFVCFGSPEALYGAALSWLEFLDKPDQSLLTLAVRSEAEAARLSRYTEAIGATRQIDIRLVKSRIQVVRLCNTAAAILDIRPLAWSGKTAPTLAAERANIRALRIDEDQIDVSDTVLTFLRTTPQSPAAPLLASDREALGAQRMKTFRDALRKAVMISRERTLHEEVAA